MTVASLTGTYSLANSYDLLARATEIKVTKSADGTTRFDQVRTFDTGGNVTSANTTLAAGTDTQAFCYDEQNRLTWAGSVGTPPCTGTGISAGTLTSAQYAQSFAYDMMGRLTSGPLGSYTYSDSAHVHAATAIGSGYTAAYDAAGDMTCRAPSSATTCTGTQTAAQLSYNSDGQVSNWQNQPTNPSSTAVFLYDGQGNRVAQQTVSGGATTTTVYVGALEEDITSGSTTTKKSYYYANGKRFAMSANGAQYAIVGDGLGSTDVILDTSGNTVYSQLFAPYGTVRFSSGSMSTDYGFTGQHSDAASGLDYYGARYYDPAAGQFSSADTEMPGNGFDVWALSRYAYVEGNPVYRIDPTGHRTACVDDPSCGDVYGSGGPTGHAGGKPVGRIACDQACHDAMYTKAGAADTAAANRIANNRFLNSFDTSWQTDRSIGDQERMALLFLAGSGNPEDWCGSTACQFAMQAALQWVGLHKQAYADALLAFQFGMAAVRAYEVASVEDLRARSDVGDGLDIHHVIQKRQAKGKIPNYDPDAATGMAVPEAEHDDIPRSTGDFEGPPESLIARDLDRLRATGAPPEDIEKAEASIEEHGF